MNDIVIMDADDEEPVCMRCIHVNDEEICTRLCGPDHCWNCYTRDVIEDAD